MGYAPLGQPRLASHYYLHQQLLWMSAMDADLLCPTPGCATVIRKKLGLHTLGEPNVWEDQAGYFVQCPKCGVRISWPPPALAQNENAD